VSYSKVTAFAPATVANVGAAFDILGFAIDRPGDSVTVTRSSDRILRIRSISGCAEPLPTDPTKNSAGVAIAALLDLLRSSGDSSIDGLGIDIDIQKGLPIGSGLGSSSASAAAAVVAVNTLLGEPLSREAIVKCAMEGERAACGSAHADNVAPAILGSVVLIRSYTPLDLMKLPTPTNVSVAVVSPRVQVRTEDARKVLKRDIRLEQAVKQWGNVGALIAGIFTNDVAVIGRSLDDHIVEPERAALIPGFQQVKAAALASGALGCTISGSGPSMFALCDSIAQAERVAAAMAQEFRALGIEAESIVSNVNPYGAHIVEKA